MASDTQVTPVAAAPVSAWERVQLARNPGRPHALAFINALCQDFVELHGDRVSGEDGALIGGLASFRGRTVMALGHQKGETTRENLERNFGMPRPEGYRKALRLMRQAEKFGFPIVAFVDTPGADPGVASEENGQAFAIAASVYALADLAVPTVAVVIGEGGSGGALAIGAADRVLMLENAIYSVASPEASAAILWKDAGRAPDAAAAMQVDAASLLRFGLIDEIVPEARPAHDDPSAVIHLTGDAIERHLLELDELLRRGPNERALLDARHAKYRAMGQWHDAATNGHDAPV
jgi:acetyl-CoA carboxylase carboxyl transferase subunit alpha